MKYQLIFIILFFSISSYCQKEEKKVTIGISENNVISGYLINETSDSISFRAQDFGIISLSKKEVAFINYESDITSNKKINSSRLKMYKSDYGVTDNAISQDKGSVYWDSKLIAFNKVSFTPLKNLSLEIGTFIPSNIFNSPYISAKYSYSFNQNLHIGVKSFYFGVDGQKYFNNSIYSTLGNLKNNITLGFHRSRSFREEYNFISNLIEKRIDDYNLISVASMVDISEKVDIRFEYIRVNELTKYLTINFGLNFKKIALSFGIFSTINSKFEYYSSANFIPILTAKIPMSTPNLKK